MIHLPVVRPRHRDLDRRDAGQVDHAQKKVLVRRPRDARVPEGKRAKDPQRIPRRAKGFEQRIVAQVRRKGGAGKRELAAGELATCALSLQGTAVKENKREKFLRKRSRFLQN